MGDFVQHDKFGRGGVSGSEDGVAEVEGGVREARGEKDRFGGGESEPDLAACIVDVLMGAGSILMTDDQCDVIGIEDWRPAFGGEDLRYKLHGSRKDGGGEGAALLNTKVVSEEGGVRVPMCGAGREIEGVDEVEDPGGSMVVSKGVVYDGVRDAVEGTFHVEQPY